MKKFVSIAVVLAMIFAMSSVAFALDSSPASTPNTLFSLSDSAKNLMMKIPIYITYIDNWDEAELSKIKESANAELASAFIDYCDTPDSAEQIQSSQRLSPLYIKQSNYEIHEIAESEKATVIAQPEFANTYNRVLEITNQGIKVNYVNFFLPSSLNTKSSGGNANDPSYWENNFPKLCSDQDSNNHIYSGYKFLYIESSVNVETDPKGVNDIGSMNWVSIGTSIAKLVADIRVKNQLYTAVTVAQDFLSAVFSGYDAPYSVTYSASSGYLKTWVSGDLYLRTILISDNLDKIPGYAYYDWGCLESFKAKIKVDAKWPVSVRPSGLYNYETNTYTYPSRHNSNTPGFYGNQTLYESVIDLYEQSIGYSSHIETIDLANIITSLL